MLGWDEKLGKFEGALDTLGICDTLGLSLGVDEGLPVGLLEGRELGSVEGLVEGWSDSATDGTELGPADG